jgi:hypothetical protein
VESAAMSSSFRRLSSLLQLLQAEHPQMDFALTPTGDSDEREGVVSPNLAQRISLLHLHPYQLTT